MGEAPHTASLRPDEHLLRLRLGPSSAAQKRSEIIFLFSFSQFTDNFLAAFVLQVSLDYNASLKTELFPRSDDLRHNCHCTIPW